MSDNMIKKELKLKVGNIAITTDKNAPASRTRGYLTRPRLILVDPKPETKKSKGQKMFILDPEQEDNTKGL